VGVLQYIKLFRRGVIDVVDRLRRCELPLAPGGVPSTAAQLMTESQLAPRNPTATSEITVLREPRLREGAIHFGSNGIGTRGGVGGFWTGSYA
jgi:hypothetical protein